jgi:hypothetical protein
MAPTPSMVTGKKVPLAVFPVNGTFYVAIYQGKLSPYDVLIKYRQFEDGKWSRIRTPKHIHWAVDILIKQHMENNDTERLIDSLIDLWDNTIQPIRSEEERAQILDPTTLLAEVNTEASKYNALAGKGEYSVKFLLLLARLLMVQEKTNYEGAYMFRNLLEQLREHKDIFKIVSTATYS